MVGEVRAQVGSPQKRFLRLYTKNFDDVAYLEKWQTISWLEVTNWKNLTVRFRIKQFFIYELGAEIYWYLVRFKYYGFEITETSDGWQLRMIYPSTTDYTKRVNLGTITAGWHTISLLHKTKDAAGNPIGRLEVYLDGSSLANYTDAITENPPNLDWTKFGYNNEGDLWVKAEVYIDWYLFKDGSTILIQHEFEETLAGFTPITLGEAVIELYPDYDQKYPFVYDAKFNIPSGDPFQTGPTGGEPPPPGYSLPSGQWHAALWGETQPEDYSYISNGKLHLKATNYDGTTEVFPTHWSGALAVQGRSPHLSIQAGRFQGSNTTVTAAIETNQIVFPFNETIPSQSLWLHAKVKIIYRQALSNQLTEFANVGILLVFQYEYVDAWGEYHLSYYDNPTWSAADPPWRTVDMIDVIFYDIFLSRHFWIFGAGEGTETTYGSEFGHQSAIYDDDLHVQRVEGEIWDLGVWHQFSVDLGYAIERAKTMTEAWLWGTSRSPTALILKQIQVFVETTGATIEAVFDHVFISTDSEAFQTNIISLNGIQNNVVKVPIWVDNELRGYVKKDQALYVYNLLKGLEYTFSTLPEVVKLVGDRMYKWEFESWASVGGIFYTPTASWVITDIGLVTVSFEYVGYNYVPPPSGGSGGAGGGWKYRSIFKSPPPEYLTIETVNRSAPIFSDEFIYAKMRETLGNDNSTFIVTASSYLKFIGIEANGIERIDFNLGKLWRESPHVKSWWIFTPELDDITLEIYQYNISRFDLYLKDVPNVISIKKNNVPFNQWNYSHGTLHIWLYPWDQTEIYIDFETPWSLTYNVLIQSSVVLIAMITVAWIYRKLCNL